MLKLLENVFVWITKEEINNFMLTEAFGALLALSSPETPYSNDYYANFQKILQRFIQLRIQKPKDKDIQSHVDKILQSTGENEKGTRVVSSVVQIQLKNTEVWFILYWKRRKQVIPWSFIPNYWRDFHLVSLLI